MLEQKFQIDSVGNETSIVSLDDSIGGQSRITCIFQVEADKKLQVKFDSKLDGKDHLLEFGSKRWDKSCKLKVIVTSDSVWQVESLSKDNECEIWV